MTQVKIVNIHSAVLRRVNFCIMRFSLRDAAQAVYTLLFFSAWYTLFQRCRLLPG